MNRSGVNRVTQIGVETTAGTSVNANRLTPTLSWNLNRKRETKTFRAQGYKSPSSQVLHKTQSDGTVEGVLDYNSHMYVFDSCFNAATPTNVGGAGTVYQRTWTQSPTVANSTGKTYTVEDGDANACDDYPYVKVTGFSIEASQDNFSIKGPLIARYPADNQTLSSSPTVVAERPVERNDVNVYLDTTAGAVGGAQLTEALAEMFESGEMFESFFVHNRSAGEFYDIVEKAYEPKGSFEAVDNSAIRTLRAALTANPYRYLRWEAQGALLATISTVDYYELIRIDCCLKFDEIERIGDENSPLGWKFNYSMMPDATLGGTMKIFTQNGLATL